MELPEDIVLHVLRTFGAHASEACERLKELGRVTDEMGPRVLRCVVHLAAGDIALLEHNVRCATADWRDVVYWAEYDRNNSKVHDFSQPFADTAEAG